MYVWLQLAGGFKNKLALGLKFLAPVGKSAHYANSGCNNTPWTNTSKNCTDRQKSSFHRTSPLLSMENNLKRGQTSKLFLICNTTHKAFLSVWTLAPSKISLENHKVDSQWLLSPNFLLNVERRSLKWVEEKIHLCKRGIPSFASNITFVCSVFMHTIFSFDRQQIFIKIQ